MQESPLSPARRRLLTAAACLLPGACATPALVPPPAQPVPPPAVRVGQRWRYETIDLYRGARRGELLAEVIRAELPGAPPAVPDAPGAPGAPPKGTAAPGGPLAAAAPIVVALRDERGAPLGEERWARAWDVIVEPAYDMVQTFEAPMPLLPERLEPGASRTDSSWYGVPHMSGRQYWRQWLRAAGWERITVPAGTFDALRVERMIDFRHFDIWRELPRRLDIVWYAPQVNRWVRRDWSGEYRWPGRRPVVVFEDRVRWQLLDWHGG
ncbi:MAG: hypothetical protein KJ011_18425 [Burkholderiaceae bacterium]|nr:hypothetical protein [Burkholderiaceae bacterium]